MKYKYMEENDLTITQLNHYGDKGWELCAVVKIGESNRYIFKRSAEELKFSVNDLRKFLQKGKNNEQPHNQS